MKAFKKIAHSVRTDATWRRASIYGGRGLRAAPQAALEYVLARFPIIGWLPHYQPRWLLSDAIAGLTVGVMLIPQSLAYAQVAGIPVEYGLMACWLPGTIYAFMGTSKDLSTGPTSLIGLLTGKVVMELKDDYHPAAIAAAVSFWIGICGLAVGLPKLGFLLEFISEPVLNGFISAAAIMIGLGQVGSLLGEPNVRTGITSQTIHDIFAQLPLAAGKTAAIGGCGIVMLEALKYISSRWGKSSRLAWFLGITRAFLTMVLFTGVSFAVNHHYKSPKNYLWKVSQLNVHGIDKPVIPDTLLLRRSASGASAVFIAAAVEHVAIARAFGAREGYTTDGSQELTYLGITNLINSFLGTMGAGGGLSRTSVNCQSGVRSPLGGLVTTATILISLYFLGPVLYWIPKATLAAIVISAIAPLIGTWRTYYNLWRTSLIDFIAAMLAFWVSLFVATEYGIAAGVGCGVVYYMLRLAFVPVNQNRSEGQSSVLVRPDFRTSTEPSRVSIAPDTSVFSFSESVFFPNATRIKAQLVDGVKTYHSPSVQISPSSGEPESSATNSRAHTRLWSVVGERRVAKLRKQVGITDSDELPSIRVLVLDFGRCTYVDYTGVHVLGQVIDEVEKYAGSDVEIRFAGLCASLLDRLSRAGWVLVAPSSIGSSLELNMDAKGRSRSVYVFDAVRDALAFGRVDDEVDEVEVEGPTKVAGE